VTHRRVESDVLGLSLEYVVKVDETSEIKNGQLCIIGAQVMAKGSRLMKN